MARIHELTLLFDQGQWSKVCPDESRPALAKLSNADRIELVDAATKILLRFGVVNTAFSREAIADAIFSTQFDEMHRLSPGFDLRLKAAMFAAERLGIAIISAVASAANGTLAETAPAMAAAIAEVLANTTPPEGTERGA